MSEKKLLKVFSDARHALVVSMDLSPLHDIEDMTDTWWMAEDTDSGVVCWGYDPREDISFEHGPYLEDYRKCRHGEQLSAFLCYINFEKSWLIFDKENKLDG